MKHASALMAVNHLYQQFNMLLPELNFFHQPTRMVKLPSFENKYCTNASAAHPVDFFSPEELEDIQSAPADIPDVAYRKRNLMPTHPNSTQRKYPVVTSARGRADMRIDPQLSRR